MKITLIIADTTTNSLDMSITITISVRIIIFCD